MVGLAGVERIPLSLRLHAQLYSNLQYLTPLSCRRLLTDGTHKNTLFPILWEDETNVQECLHMVKWGVQRVVSEPPQAPGHYNISGYHAEFYEEHGTIGAWQGRGMACVN